MQGVGKKVGVWNCIFTHISARLVKGKQGGTDTPVFFISQLLLSLRWLQLKKPDR